MSVVAVYILKLTILLAYVVVGGICWNYNITSESGPDEWGETCKGHQQSPVDINLENIDIFVDKYENEDLVELRNYNKSIVNATLRNTGEFLKIDMPQGPNEPVLDLTARFLTSTYRLHYITFHWKSEHRFGGSNYPLEAHFVHLNEKLEDSTAMNETNGVVVLSILFQQVDDIFVATESPSIDPMDYIIQTMRYVSEKGSHHNLSVHFNLQRLLPMDRDSVVHYRGSMTSPPCAEIVDWIIFTQPAKIIARHVEIFDAFKLETSFETLYGYSNSRPPQELGTRKLKLRTKKAVISEKSGGTRRIELHFTLAVVLAFVARWVK